MIRLLPVGPFVLLFALQVQSIAQVPGQNPPRDQPPPQQQPTERRIAVGTASIGGTITAADTGRPIRGARVSVNVNTNPVVNRAGNAGLTGAPIATAASPRAQGPGAAAPQVNVPATGTPLTPARGRAGGGQIVVTSASRSATTDERGNFLIEHLPAGQVSLTVQTTGLRGNSFLPAVYGQKRFNGPGSTFQLAEGQRAKIDMQLQRGGVITGTAYNEEGDPLSNAQVRAWRYTRQTGVRRLQSAGTSAQTDDRGVYRLFGLQPGEYLVSVTPDSNVSFNPIANNDEALIAQAFASGTVNPPAAPGMPATVSVPVRTPQLTQQLVEQRQYEPPPGYLPVYYPESSMPQGARIIQVNGGDEKTNIDIHARLVQATNITGTITNPPGQDMAVQLSLVNDDPVSENMSNISRADNNGRFTFRNVVPGKYTLLAQVVVTQTMTVVTGPSFSSSSTNPQPLRTLDDSQQLFARALVSVDGQPNITTDLTLKPCRSISGRVVFEMERVPDLSRQRGGVSLASAPGVQPMMFGPQSPGDLAPDGTFTIKGVIPGKYIPRVTFGFAKSVMYNGQDLLDFPLNFTGERDVTDVVITVTDKYSEVSGALTDGAGKPATDYSVVAASTDERFWTPGSRRIAVARTSQDGTYMLRNLPPGEYVVGAVGDLEYGGQYDPDFLKSLLRTSGMRISVTEDSKISQNLQVR